MAAGGTARQLYLMGNQILAKRIHRYDLMVTLRAHCAW